MDYLLIIYCLYILGCELIILLFGFVFSVYPGKKYRLKIPKIQLEMSILAIIPFILICILSYIYPDQINNSYFRFEISKAQLVVPSLIVFCSIYKYKSMNLQECIISLKSTDYQLHNEFNMNLDNVPYMPNVKSFANYSDGVIVFSANRPVEPIDADFICKEIGPNIYDCSSYIKHKKEKMNFKRLIRKINTIGVFCAMIVAPFLIVFSDYLNTYGLDLTYYSSIKEAYVPITYSAAVFEAVYMYGVFSKKLFCNNKDIISKIFFWFGEVCVVLSFSYLIEFLQIFI